MIEAGYIKSGALVNKKFREFFMSTVLMSVAAQLGVIIDSIIVGNMIDSSAMASVSICMPLNQVSSALSLLISVGAGGLAAIASGARQHEEADKIFTAVTVLSLLLGILMTAVCLPFAWELADFLATEDTLDKSGWEYLHVMIWRFPFMFVLTSISVLIRSDGMPGLASQAVILGQITNVTLDILFIKYMNMGLPGVALTTVISDIVSSFYMLLFYFISSERTFHFVSIKKYGLKAFLSLCWKLIVSGVPAATGVALVAVKVWCIYAILAEIGDESAIAIYAVCMSCLGFVSMFITGSHRAMIPVAGVLYGEKDYGAVRMLVRYVLCFTLSIIGVFVLFVLVFPQAILQLFNILPEAIIEGLDAVRLFSVSLLGVTVTFLMIYYYTTVQQRFVANMLSWTEGLLAVVPLAWFLSRIMGFDGVWVAFILAEIIGFLCLFVCVKFICKSSGGKYSDIYLIEKKEKTLLYDVSIKATNNDASKISDEVIRVLTDSGVAHSTANKAGVALEEITANLSNYTGNKKPADIDIRIGNTDGLIVISLRDNGKPFNPVDYTPSEMTEYQTDGIMLLKAIAKNIQYNRVLSLNQTIIEI